MLKNYFDQKRRWDLRDDVLESYDFSDIEGYQVGLTKKQIQMLETSQKNLKDIL